MDAQRLTGPQAGVVKYDLLTAIAVAGLHGSSTFQTSMMRLTALITARYNWRTREFTVGQRDIARMWAVNERTVKREIKRLTDTQILICTRKGVRGRVAAYRLNLPEIYRRSMPHWAAVGPDFEERMSERYKPDASVVRINFRNPNPETNNRTATKDHTPPSWRHVLKRLRESHPDLVENWFSRLTLKKVDNDVLWLEAPNKFMAKHIETHFAGILIYSASRELGSLEAIRVTWLGCE